MQIKELLQLKQMKQQDLADKMGISLSAVKQMLNAESLTTTTLTKIADALDVPMWRLFTTKEEILEDESGTSTGACPHCGKPITIKTTIE